MSIFDGMEPKRPLYHFEKIATMPHGSGNVKEISDYVVTFAKEHNLKYIQDSSLNVIVFKDAYPGYEQAEPVILQGHLDMVCEKDESSTIDFKKDGLNLMLLDDVVGNDSKVYLTADGTTLGADDGVAVAYMLSLLEDDKLKAPALECVFTVDEEIGMLGASAMDLSVLKGRRMINLDNGEEGIFLAGCAGGVTATCHLPVKREKQSQDYKSGSQYYTLEVSGLVGGHSGEEIIKQRASANVILGRVLYLISSENSIKLLSIEGGLKDNAIPRSSRAILMVTDDTALKISKLVETMSVKIADEFAVTDPDLKIVFNKIDNIDGNTEEALCWGCLTDDECTRAIAALYSLPNGVQKMSVDIEGLVQTSLNMGILNTREDEITYSFSVRSSVATEKEELKKRIECIMNMVGGCVSYDGDYPAWEYVKDSKLQKQMSDIYEEMFGTSPKIGTIHAGLECGIFFDALKGLDCVSIGPAMFDIHTPLEKLELGSFSRCYNYLSAVLERAK